MSQHSDPTLDRIRQVRHEISEAVGHDPHRLVEYYMRLQEQHRNRLVDTAEIPPPAKSAA
ncbi:MAG TPA: hypothetical protein VLK66_09775 [Longimicrobium sp.]|nr:hypothetical protein [Longimicrobium sp.]